MEKKLIQYRLEGLQFIKKVVINYDFSTLYHNPCLEIVLPVSYLSVRFNTMGSPQGMEPLFYDANQIRDIEYMQNNLFKALMVPKSVV